MIYTPGMSYASFHDSSTHRWIKPPTHHPLKTETQRRDFSYCRALVQILRCMLFFGCALVQILNCVLFFFGWLRSWMQILHCMLFFSVAPLDVHCCTFMNASAFCRLLSCPTALVRNSLTAKKYFVCLHFHSQIWLVFESLRLGGGSSSISLIV